MLNNTKRLYIYVAITLFCGLFSFVYEHFSHDVYSSYMVYLFAFPLVLGVLPQGLALLFPKLGRGGPWQPVIHGFAVATLTVGSLLQGIVEIYGTSTRYITYYFAAGAVLLLMSTVMWAAKPAKYHHPDAKG